MKAVWASVAAMALAIGATNAIAQTKEVTIAHQDMNSRRNLERTANRGQNVRAQCAQAEL